MKALHAIAGYFSDAYELVFRTAFVNEMVPKLCECIRVSFQERKPDQTALHFLEAFPPLDIQLRVLSLSVTKLRAVLYRVVADHLQRYSIERLLLVGCSTLQHFFVQDACPNVIQI